MTLHDAPFRQLFKEAFELRPCLHYWAIAKPICRTREKDWDALVQSTSESSFSLIQILTLVLWASWRELKEQVQNIPCPEKCAEELCPKCLLVLWMSKHELIWYSVKVLGPECHKSQEPITRSVHLHCIREPTHAQTELFLDVFPANVCLCCGPHIPEITLKKMATKVKSCILHPFS